jgi:predicted dehydrogenase
MTSLRVAVWGLLVSASAVAAEQPTGDASGVRFVTLEPGHFHAALVQKEMHDGVSPTVHVYASSGPDLLGHLGRIAAFNAREGDPTRWQLEVHIHPEPLERMLEERPGNVVILSGRNRGKIDAILASVRAGMSVLADKPWILEPADLPKLEEALRLADEKGLVAYDLMTERLEITSILQRELVSAPEVFGAALEGTPEEPAVYVESVHHLMKTVAGAPNLRPPWFFDTAHQGEGLNDVGTHLVDLVQWTLFPDRAIDHASEVEVLAAQRWPTPIDEEQFRRVTGTPGFPEALRDDVRNGKLDYFCNTLVSYRLAGVHVALNVIWDWEAPAGSGDRHFAYYRGDRSRIEVRQSADHGFRPELFVVPVREAEREAIRSAIERRLRELDARYPGLGLEDRGAEIQVVIPEGFRVGHEAHFAEVTASFLRFMADRSALPAWERPNMLAKYYVTTTGAALSRRGSPSAAPRKAP